MNEIWTLIHTERAALADDLADLTDDQWATTSLCTELTVREVLAHLTAAASMGPLRWMAGVIRCRFDFDKQVAMRLAQQLGATPTETLDRFRSVRSSTTKPPIPVLAMLGETIVHGTDIRRPLGLRRAHPIETLTRVAEYYQGTDQVVLAKGRIGGLRLEATDGPFTTGTGTLVTGPTLALIMAMTGRATFCDDLAGAGVALLREPYADDVLLRPAHDHESALLSDLALRSKGHWGYDVSFLESCREELTLTPELLTEERAQVAERDGQVVGFYTLAGRPPEGQLGHMFVEPDQVKAGIGRALWEHAIDTATKEGIRRILIEADPHAEAFYLAMGATRVGEVPSGSIPGRELPLLAYYISEQ